MASTPNQNFFRMEMDTIEAERQKNREYNSYGAGIAAQPAVAAAAEAKNRMCPTATSLFRSFSYAEFSPFVAGQKPLLVRRISMLGILGIRTATSILFCFYMIRFSLAWFIIDVISSVMGFLCVVWILKTLGNVVGRRRILGVMVGQAQVDVFLIAMLVIHGGMIVLSVLSFLRIAGHSVWFLLFILMWLAAWATTWPAEVESQEYV